MNLNRLNNPEEWVPYIEDDLHDKYKDCYEDAVVYWNININSDLSKFCMSFRGLTKLPLEIWSLTEIEELYLIGNSLEEIPAEISQLTKLKCLQCSDNKLKNLPPEIISLEFIEEIYCDRNNFEDPELQEIADRKENVLPYLQSRAGWHIKSANKY